MTDTPTYRAKKRNSDEYIEGQFCVYSGHPTIFDANGNNGTHIEQSTLAIHFPTMISREGTKIFASFDSDNGTGGDIVEIVDNYYVFVFIVDRVKFIFCLGDIL